MFVSNFLFTLGLLLRMKSVRGWVLSPWAFLLYLIPTMCILPDKKLNTLLLFIVNLAHDEVKISKGHALTYLTPVQYENLSDVQENNQAGKITNISVTTSETNLNYCQLSPPLLKLFFQVITHLSVKSCFKMQTYQWKLKRNLMV